MTKFIGLQHIKCLYYTEWPKVFTEEFNGNSSCPGFAFPFSNNKQCQLTYKFKYKYKLVINKAHLVRRNDG